MTVEELRRKRKELIAERNALIESGGDKLEIQLISEDLVDVNSALRRITPGHRIGQKRPVVGIESGDRQQYENWAAQRWGDYSDNISWDFIESESNIYKAAVMDAENRLTQTEKKYFDLFLVGKRKNEIAKILHVNQSTVSREIALIKKKLGKAAEYIQAADIDGNIARLDISDSAAAKLIISVCTAKQIVFLYLYYGEWLSCSEIGKLLGIDKTSALRGVTRGLLNVHKLFPGKEIVLDNMDALGDIAYALYADRDWTNEELEVEELNAKKFDWGRRLLGKQQRAIRKPDFFDRPQIIVTTSYGDMASVKEHRKEIVRAPKSKLMTALLERLRSNSQNDKTRIGVWIASLFQKIKNLIRTKGVIYYGNNY